MFNRQIDR